MSKQGLACVVMTPTMQYQGQNALTQAFTIDQLAVQVVENPNINRPRLKKLGLSAGTALDICLRATDVLAGPQSGHYGEFTTRDVQQGEDSNLIVAKATFGTTIYKDISGIISTDISGHTVEIPFVTKDQISGLVGDVYSLSNLIIGFDTEDIKERLGVAELDIEDLYVKHFDLSNVYQPIGQYVTPDDLTAYAYRSDVPRYTSQLTNDSGFLSAVRWDEVTEKPDFPTMADIPTRTSQLVNDSITIDSIGGVRAHNGRVNGSLVVGLQGENIGNVEIYEGDYEDGGHLIVNGGNNSGGTINVTGPGASIQINGVPIKTEIDIPTKLSEFENDVGYLTAHQDLTDYATKTWVNDKGYLTEHQSLSGYATEEWINSQGYLTEHQSLDGYATEEWVESKNYLTSHQSLDGYATENWVNSQGYLTAHQPLTGYMPINGTTDIRRFKLEYTYRDVDRGIEWDGKGGTLGAYGDGANFWVGPGASFQVDQDWDQIKKILTHGAPEDFTYQTLPEYLSTLIPTKTSQLENDSNFISVLPDMTGYYTKTESNDRFQPIGNYLTEHQSLANYYTIDEVQANFQPKGNYLTEHQSLANYYTKQECDDRFGSGSATTTKLFSENGNRYIDGNGNVWKKSAEGHWTRWTYSDGNYHDDPVIWKQTIGEQESWYITIDDNNWKSTQSYSSEDEAIEFLNSTTTIYFTQPGVEMTATREWIPADEFVIEDELAKKSEIPTKATDLTNDAGYLTAVQWNDITYKPNIPNKTSQLINDSNYISSVHWSDIADKPGFIDQTDIEILSNNISIQINKKLDKADYNNSEIVNGQNTKKIDANGDVYVQDYVPGHWTDWEWSDGIDHSQEIIIYPEYPTPEDRFYAAIAQDTYRTELFDTREDLQDFLNNSDHIEWKANTENIISSDRQWIESQNQWVKSDELAYRSEIPTDYATQNDITTVRSLINQNSTRISTTESSISQINNQLNSIRSDITTITNDIDDIEDDVQDNSSRISTVDTSVSQLRTTVNQHTTSISHIENTLEDGEWTEVEATLEDESTVTFEIFTRGL